MEYEEIKIRRKAASELLQALVPALGIADIAVTDKKVIVKMDDKYYVVNDGGRMGVKAMGEVVRDLILYGRSDRVTYVKEAKF